MEWPEGKHFVTSFQEKGIDYNFWVSKNTENATNWFFHLSKGAWQVPTPDDIWVGFTDEFKIPPSPDATPEEISASIKIRIMDPLNLFLIQYFGGGIPSSVQTRFEKVEAIISKMIFFRNAENIPQVKIAD